MHTTTALTSALFATFVAAQSCNPAHSYPSGQLCDGSSASPSLITVTTSYPAGSTLSNGGYVCNPAHSYPSGQSCDASGPTPTLVTITTPYPAGSTLPDGGYVCNPAHAYPSGQVCEGSGGTPTLVTITGTTSKPSEVHTTQDHSASAISTSSSSLASTYASTYTGAVARCEFPTYAAFAAGLAGVFV